MIATVTNLTNVRGKNKIKWQAHFNLINSRNPTQKKTKGYFSQRAV